MTKAKTKSKLPKVQIPQLEEIQSVGVELEGGICSKCAVHLIKIYRRSLHLNFSFDGSVLVEADAVKCKHYHNSGSGYDDLNPYWRENGELKAWVNVRSLPKLFTFVKELFESGFFAQNDSCGNHIHIRLKDKTKYERKFGTREAWNKFIRAYSDAFEDIKYHNRLTSRYCNASFNISKIHSTNHDDRYSMINFVSLAERQNTLEFRILPHFTNSSEAIRAYTKMLAIINKQAHSR